MKALVIAAALVIADLREPRARPSEEPDPTRDPEGSADPGVGQSAAQPLGRDPGWSRPAQPEPTVEEALEELIAEKVKAAPEMPQSTSISWEMGASPRTPQPKDPAALAA